MRFITTRLCYCNVLVLHLSIRGLEPRAPPQGITLLSVVGKVFCKVLNNTLVQHFDKCGVLHEGQAGFRLKRCCVDNINELVQGRMKEGKRAFAFFLDVQKAYDTVWRNGLWLK